MFVSETATSGRREAEGDPSHTPVLRLRQVTVGYADRAALRDVDLRLDRGDVLALVGSNGSGKSTLVRGILGLATVLSGEVELFGVPAARFRERWRIGYVPQRHTVAGAVPATVEEVVAAGRIPRHPWRPRLTRADREAVAAAVDAVGLADRRRSPVATLSGGQQRRVLIARALASEPDVMIMDEPTAGVDAAGQDRLVATLEGLVSGGMTLLVVTHELAMVASLLTRVVRLEAGRVVLDGPADAVLPRLAGEVAGGCHCHDPATAPDSPGWLGQFETGA